MKLEDELNRSFSLSKMIDSLDFLETDIVGASMRQPKLLLESARYRVVKMRRRVQAETTLAIARAEEGLRLRKFKDSTGKKKYSEDAIKNMLEKAPEVATARQVLDRAYVEEEYAKQLLSAYMARQSALKVVVQSNLAEFGRVLRTYEDSGAVDKMKDLKKKARSRMLELGLEEEEEE